VSALDKELTALLLRPINPSRVFRKEGQSHLAAWDVRAHLIRCFGFAGWSAETVALELIHDLETTTKAGKSARKVAYRAHVRLTIHATGATYSEWATGEATMPDFKHGDAHDFALKTAESQALKRCAMNLGSQFGLSLYDNGNMNDVVRGVFSVKFDDAVTVTDEGTEPGAVVDTETGEIAERPADRLSATPADDPWYSGSDGGGGEALPSEPVTLANRTPRRPDAPYMDAPDGPPTKAQMGMLGALLKGQSREQALAVVSSIVGREVASRNELTKAETSAVIDALKQAAS
jgi:hypothetical protein